MESPSRRIVGYVAASLLAVAGIGLGLWESGPGALVQAGAFLAAAGIVTAVLVSSHRRERHALAARVEKLEQAEKESVAATRSRERLLAHVSHEIRTPITGVIGMTELLLMSTLTPKQRERVEVIRSSAEALVSLVNDLLDLSRIEAGRLRLKEEDFRLQEMVGDVVSLLEPGAEAKKVALRLEVAPGLPDSFHGDPQRLRQVLLNLVGNGIRYSRDGGSVIVVLATADDATGPGLRVEIRDTGMGIREEVQSRLFQPFSQSESAAWKVGGTGLGLVISREIVEAMGGEIGFESTRGVGSTFWFRVPRVPGKSASKMPARDTTQVLLMPVRDREAPRILVVDDDSVNRSIVLALLGALGYDADAEESGEAALAGLARRRYDAMLLDCEMPGLSGYETCRRLRRRENAGRRLPVIAVTAHALVHEREACLAAGMDDCLTKPFGSAELAAVLDRWLGRSEATPITR